MSDHQHALDKVLEAASYGDGGPGPLSTSEKLMAALALNRPDWLAAMDYTIVEALERIGAEWRAALPAVARAASGRLQDRAAAREHADEAIRITQFSATATRQREPVPCEARLVTTGSAPRLLGAARHHWTPGRARGDLPGSSRGPERRRAIARWRELRHVRISEACRSTVSQNAARTILSLVAEVRALGGG